MTLLSPGAPLDRSRDLSQPLERLNPDEALKAGSDQLRGTILKSLADPITGAVAPPDTKLMKFHGIYQQDDRDLRDERRRQKLEPAYQFMLRVRLPGGVCTSAQWLALDALGRAYGGDTLRLTTRQTFQFHWVLKHQLKPLVQGLHDAGLDSVAACGDDARGVMASVNPAMSAVHAEVYALAKRTSDHVIPRMRAYREIWLDEERTASAASEEPFYGPTYMPRKFKIGFVVPPDNDIDVYTQDLGFIAITGPRGLEGYTVCIGGGMGRTDNAPKTYPRLANVIGFVTPDQVLPVCDAVMSVQRDYGDRVDRAHARFKYTVDDRGLDWIKTEIETRLGARLAEARPYRFVRNGDPLGWRAGDDGLHHLTLLIQNGRIANHGNERLMDALREVARLDCVTFRLTPNQNLTLADIPAERRDALQAVLQAHGVPPERPHSGLRNNAIACVALPTCALAMAESERYLPTLVDKLERILVEHGVGEQPITIRMSGCPNGCSRPYVAEIGFTGRAPGKYNVYLGGGFHGERLNKMYLENVGEAVILRELGKIIEHYARERRADEHFGDFVIRSGYVPEVTEGRFFNA